jgi:hypothetical protein
MAMREATEKFGTMLRWTQEPKNADQAEKTVYKGDSIQGFYVNKRTGVGQNDSNVYEIELAGGELVSMWGSALIDGKFDEIPMGCEVRVEYLGIAQPRTAGGRPYANFKILFDETSKKPMSEAGAAPAAFTEAPIAAADLPPSFGGAPSAPAAPQPAAPAPQPTSSDAGY